MRQQRSRPFIRLSALACGMALVALLTVGIDGAGAAGRGPQGAHRPHRHAGRHGKALPPGIPAADRGLYTGNGVVPFSVVPLKANPMKGFVARKGPWKFCLAEDITGEPFRTGPPLGEDGMLKAMVAQLHKEHLATGKLLEAVANGSVTTQLTQLNNFISEGCSAIFLDAASLTGVCSAVQKAFAHHIAVVAASETKCPDSVGVDFNDAYYAYLAATNLAKRIGRHGNVLLLNAIPGEAVTVSETAGAEKALARFPKIHIVGQVYGDFTPSIAKAHVLQWASSHPGTTLQGVWQAGLMSAPAALALQQAGMSSAKVETFAGSCGGLAYWHKVGGSNFAFDEAGEPYGYEMMQAMIRILKGAKPAVNVLLFPGAMITSKNLRRWYQKGMTLTSACYPNVPKQFRPEANVLNGYFRGLPSSFPKLTYFTAPVKF